MANERFNTTFKEALYDALVSGEERTGKDWVFDIVIAVVAFIFGCAQLLLTSTSVVYVDRFIEEMVRQVDLIPSLYSYTVLGLTTLPLVLRRVAPWPTLVIVLVCFLFGAQYMYGFSLSPVGPVVAMYSVASERSRIEAVAAALIVGVCMIFAPMPLQSATLALIIKGTNVALVASGGMAGFAMRTHEAYLDETQRRLEEAERGREELAARRVAEERVRIARDVHDITAHSLSAVTIQAAAAERLMDSDPVAAREAVADIRSVSKSALDEIRSLIGVLRGDEEAEHAPAEGTERMGDLVNYLKRADLHVSFSAQDYDRAAVPAFVDMTLYQVAREAATNTVRHAQAHAADILLQSTPEVALVRVSDDGRGMDVEMASQGEGHGLRGMAERVGAMGGSFSVNSVPGRGCAVEARIPLEANHGSAKR